MIPLLLSLSSASSAIAGEREISASVGLINTDDPNWTMFGSGNVLPSFGARFAYPVLPHVKVVAGYEYAQDGSHVSVYDDTGEDGTESQFQTGFFAHQAMVGGKVHWSASKWVSLYGIAQGDFMVATVRIDDDPDDDSNPGQVERAGATGGVLAAAGVGINVPILDGRTAWEFHAELGYGYLAPLAVEDIGQLEFSGLSFRAGTGFVF